MAKEMYALNPVRSCRGSTILTPPWHCISSLSELESSAGRRGEDEAYESESTFSVPDKSKVRRSSPEEESADPSPCKCLG